jgi:1,4-dihydroxy-2-naphthoate octaprenyltransferase
MIVSKTPWVQETRPQFLLLAVMLVAHASALAAWQGSFDLVRALLAGVALVLMHGSVNALNDWHDWHKTGIDKATPRTPFSGGSGLIPAGRITAQQALVVGVVTLAGGCAIGLYLAWLAGWQLLALGVAGALMIVLYTPVFNKLGLGEIFAGLGLGLLPVLGTYFLLTGRFDTVAWVSGIPAFCLTYNLLLLNEFPDVEADKAGGRRHMITLLGKKGGRWLYSAMEIAAYVVLVIGVVTGVLTPWALLGLGGAVFAARAIKGAMTDYEDFGKTVAAQGANVVAVLSTNALLFVGYLIAALTS